VVRHVEGKVDSSGLPAKELGVHISSFSAPILSWSGLWEDRLTPPVSGEYVFSLAGAGAGAGAGTARLLLDGHEVVLLNKVNFSAAVYGRVHLEPGQTVALRLEHSDVYAVLGSSLQLGWAVPEPARWEEALKAAAAADVAIVFAGEQLGEGMDKRSLGMPATRML
jgi:hypothetical protein